MKSITTYEIEKCISLLHPHYQNICPVKIGGTLRNRFKKITLFKNLNTTDLTLGGYYVPNKRRDGTIDTSAKEVIYLFPKEIFTAYDWEEDEEGILSKKKWIIFCLYHEIRHAYQFNSNKMFKHLTDDQYLEKDANRFAYRMMKKHSEKIEKILKLEVK